MSTITSATTLYSPPSENKIPTRYCVAGSALVISLVALAILTTLACTGVFQTAPGFFIALPGLCAIGSLIALAIYAVQDASNIASPHVDWSAPPKPESREEEEDEEELRPLVTVVDPPVVGFGKAMYNASDIPSDLRRAVEGAVQECIHVNCLDGERGQLNATNCCAFVQFPCQLPEEREPRDVFILFYTKTNPGRPKHLAYFDVDKAHHAYERLEKEYTPVTIKLVPVPDIRDERVHDFVDELIRVNNLEGRRGKMKHPFQCTQIITVSYHSEDSDTTRPLHLIFWKDSCGYLSYLSYWDGERAVLAHEILTENGRYDAVNIDLSDVPSSGESDVSSEYSLEEVQDVVEDKMPTWAGWAARLDPRACLLLDRIITSDPHRLEIYPLLQNIPGDEVSVRCFPTELARQAVAETFSQRLISIPA